MKHKKRKLSILLLLGCSLTYLHAQQTIPASGGGASGAGGKASYTIGQLVYSTSKNENHSIACGVQQPYEISVITSIKNAPGINLSFAAYPNPVEEHLLLRIDGNLKEPFVALLYDTKSNLLKTKKNVSNQTIINMSNLAPGVYFLKIMQNREDLSGKVIKTFKIIKN